MRTSLRKRQISVFAKILFIFLLVVFPLYIVSIQINITGQNDVRQEIIRSARSKVNFYVSSLEREFASAIRMQSRLVVNEDVRLLASPSVRDDNYAKYDRYRSMNNVRDKLNELVETNAYISEAVIYIPTSNCKITNDVVQDMPMEEFDRLKALVAQNLYPFSEQDGEILINMTPGLYKTVRNADDLSYIISVKVSKSRVESVLKQLSEDGNVGVLLLGGKGGLNIQPRKEGSLLPYLNRYLTEHADEKAGLDTLETDQGKHIIAYEKSVQLASTLVIFTPEAKFIAQLTRYRTWLWIVSILTLLTVSFFTLWIKGMIARPLDKLVTALRKLEDGDFNIAVKYGSNDEFGYLYKQFNQIFNRLRTLIEQVYEQKILVQNAELKQLQYQINPHFLYNSLLIIYSLIKMGDHDCAMKLSQHMGNYYQYITRSSSEEVPLIKEITHARDYVEIQSIRFSNRIKAEFDAIPEGAENLIVPRLIVQPIIENSYNHGLKDKVRGGLLKVRLRQEESVLCIFIEDNGEEMSEEKLRGFLESTDPAVERSGLLNVHRRIRIKYGNDSGLYVSKGEHGGLCVEIRIRSKEESISVQPAHSG